MKLTVRPDEHLYPFSFNGLGNELKVMFLPPRRRERVDDEVAQRNLSVTQRQLCASAVKILFSITL